MLRLITPVALAVACALPSAALSQVSVSERVAEGQPPIVIAHRAQIAGAPENALAGIERAIAHGIGMIKIDTQLTRDGHYVLMHDLTLNRTTDVETVFADGAPLGPTRAQRAGKDFVGDYRLEDLRQLSLISDDSGTRHAIPTLNEALDLIDQRVLVALDLKKYAPDSIITLLNKRDTQNVMLFGIFYYDHALLKDVSQATGLKTLVAMQNETNLVLDIDKLARALGEKFALVSIQPKRLTAEVLERARSHGILIATNGVRSGADADLADRQDPTKWNEMLDLGLAAYLTGLPVEVSRLLEQK